MVQMKSKVLEPTIASRQGDCLVTLPVVSEPLSLLSYCVAGMVQMKSQGLGPINASIQAGCCNPTCCLGTFNGPIVLVAWFRC